MTSSANSSSIPFMLRNVSEAARTQLWEAGTLYELGKKESLPVQTNPPKHVIFVESGWFSIAIHNTTVSILKQGDTFMGPLPPSKAPSSITLTAVTASTAILIEREPLLGVLHERPDLLFCLYEQASERVTRTLIQQAYQHKEGLELRLTSFLWGLGLPNEEGQRTVPAINQAVLADCMRTSREEISRKQQLLVQSGNLRHVGSNWLMSAEVGKVLATRGYGE